jgi:hypothetical protein
MGRVEKTGRGGPERQGGQRDKAEDGLGGCQGFREPTEVCVCNGRAYVWPSLTYAGPSVAWQYTVCTEDRTVSYSTARFNVAVGGISPQSNGPYPEGLPVAGLRPNYLPPPLYHRALVHSLATSLLALFFLWFARAHAMRILHAKLAPGGGVQATGRRILYAKRRRGGRRGMHRERRLAQRTRVQLGRANQSPSRVPPPQMGLQFSTHWFWPRAAIEPFCLHAFS